MKKIVVFPKEALLAAAEIGSIKGYNRSLSEEGIKAFKEEIDAIGTVNFPVSFSMVHEHIAGVKVEPHIRAVIQVDAKGSSITLDVDMKLFNSLPVFDTETGEFEVAA